MKRPAGAMLTTVKLAGLGLALSADLAHAAPVPGSVIEYAADEPPRPLQALHGTACELRVDLHGAVATIELRETFANTGSEPFALREDLGLPTGAVVYGGGLALDRAYASLAAVPAQFSTVVADPAASDVIGPDPLLLQVMPGGGVRATLQPIAPGHDAKLVTRYVVLADIAGGAFSLNLPGRGDGAASCKGTLTATPGPGVRITGLRAAGSALHGGAFTVGAQPVALAAAFELAGDKPVLWTQTYRLTPDWRASLVTVIAPALRPHAVPGKVVFVVDGSRSMELVGTPRVVQVMRAVAAALPAGSELEAIVYDRHAARVLGEFRPASPATLDALEAGLRGHAASNGSDLAAGFALAHQALAGARGVSRVIAITDGVIDGDRDDARAGDALAQALDSTVAAIDVHAIVLDPGHTHSPGVAALRGPIYRYGGSLVEVDADDLDGALRTIDDWFRPAALELSIATPPTATPVAIDGELRGGRGATRLYVHREPRPQLTLTGHLSSPFTIANQDGPEAPIYALALAGASIETFAGDDNPSAPARANAQRTLTAARAQGSIVDDNHALAVLSRSGKIASSRRDMIGGGGRYERVVALADPGGTAPVPPAAAALPAPSAIDKLTLERLFRDQLSPRAYACYQRALGRAPRLAGTFTFDLRIGRGEVSQATITGVADDEFLACLTDAAFALQPPLPDFAVNADDQTIVHYPLSFAVKNDRAQIMAGDADSSSPLDIDAIKGGVPERRKPVKVDASTPMGNLPRR
jgi:hypothetical protein